MKEDLKFSVLMIPVNILSDIFLGMVLETSISSGCCICEGFNILIWKAAICMSW